MEKQLDVWLKTYKNEDKISPAIWDDLPSDCKIKLDNFARDEAVRRADEFAREGFLDLNRQEAIGQLVDSMAQSWKLNGNAVRTVVEDFYDELPASAGFEFDKLGKRLYRRRDTLEYSTLKKEATFEQESKIVNIIFNSLDIDNSTVLSYNDMLIVCKHQYDKWSLSSPKEAVDEIFILVGKKDKEVEFSDIIPFLRQRGANNWVQALEYEKAVDVSVASKSDMIRILKRYALMARHDETLPRTTTPETTPTVSQEIVEETIEVAPVSDTPIENSEDNGAQVSDYEETETSKESDVEITFANESANSSSNEESLDEETIVDVANEPAETEDLEADNEAELPEDSSEESDDDVNEVKPPGNSIRYEMPRIEIKRKKSDPLLEEDSDKNLQNGLDVGEQENNNSSKIMGLSSTNRMYDQQQRIQDVFTASPHDDKRDRFAKLREGELRIKIVKEMYSDDSTMLDVFLAKLSGAPDWNRAKQFIANEFFRCKMDLHSDLGEEIFLVLKESLQDN
jgi:hypothetical protein